MVCKLLKALYSLKQLPQLWYKRLANFFLEKLDLKRINADHNIFATKAGLDRPVVSIFVNDIKIMALKSNRIIERVKLKLTFNFSMINMGPISFYLGLKVQQDSENWMIKLSELAYINKVINKFQLNKANTVNTSIKKTTLFKQKTEGETSLFKKKHYQNMTGFFHVLNSWNKAQHRLCHLCHLSFCKESRSLIHRGCENNLAIPEGLKQTRNYLWQSEQLIGVKILRFWLGGRQKKSEVNLWFYLYAQ